jgi:MraZ protein
MSHFKSLFQNKRDGKGRVAVPADYRALLGPKDAGSAEDVKKDSAVCVVLRRSHIPACIEAWPKEVYYTWAESQVARQEQLDAGRRDREAANAVLQESSEAMEGLITRLFTDIDEVPLDSEGRIIIPKHLVDYAGLGGDVMFFGRRDHFHIWEPQAGAAFREASRVNAVRAAA